MRVPGVTIRTTRLSKPPLAPNAARHFLPGAGEALPFQSLGLRLEGVIKIEGTLLRYVRHP